MQLPIFKRHKSQALLPVTIGPEQPGWASAPHWKAALERWKERLAGQSQATAATYTSAARVFFLALERAGVSSELEQITLELLEEYAGAQRLKAGKDTPPAERAAPATVNIRLAALKAFLLYCVHRGWLADGLTRERIKEALSGIKAHVQRPYQIVEGQDELAAMLQAAEQDKTDAARALALVMLGLGAGLRISELCVLDVAHIGQDKDGYFVDVAEGKGRKQRQVSISQDTYDVLREYLDSTGRTLHRAADRDTPLFLTRKRRASAGRLCVRHARRIIEACAERAGLENRKHITPHGLRHSYAFLVLLGDKAQGIEPAPLPAVSKMLGHSNVAITGRYLAHFERKELAGYAPSPRKRAGMAS